MKDLNEAIQKAKEMFENSKQTIPGNWAKWCHYGIPDFPEEERKQAIEEFAKFGHCKDCTAMSGCYFIDGDKTFPRYPHHPHCHCEKIPENPNSVMAVCKLDKFTCYAFTNTAKALWMQDMDFDVSQSEYLNDEFERQAKEKYISGDYELKRLNEHGQRINIKIETKNMLGKTKYFISGWMVRPQGLITCNTPFGDK